MKKLSLWLLAILLTFFVANACKDEQSPVAPKSDALEGYFYDAEGNALADVTVEVTDANLKVIATAITKPDGSFELTNLPTQTANSIVSFIKDEELLLQVTLNTLVKIAEDNATPSKSKKAEIFLGGDYDYDTAFSVIVVDINTQDPIEFATVVLATSKNAALTKTTDNTGTALFEEVVPGMYSLSISKTGYNTLHTNFLLMFPQGMDEFS